MNHKKTIKVDVVFECTNMSSMKNIEPDTTASINHKVELDAYAESIIIDSLSRNGITDGEFKPKVIQGYSYSGIWKFSFE
jgi:hypothetical protein